MGGVGLSKETLFPAGSDGGGSLCVFGKLKTIYSPFQEQTPSSKGLQTHTKLRDSVNNGFYRTPMQWPQLRPEIRHLPRVHNQKLIRLFSRITGCRQFVVDVVVYRRYNKIVEEFSMYLFSVVMDFMIFVGDKLFERYGQWIF